MNISSLNNINFGKKAVMTCSVKTKDNEKHSATLYLMDKNNLSDREEIANDAELAGIKKDFLGFSPISSASKFYVLRNDDSGEVVSSAETYRRQKRNDFENSYTVIEELQDNKKYVDSITPLLAQIASDAYRGSDFRIETAFRSEDNPSLAKLGFKEGRNEEWVMPKRGFNNAMQKAELRNNAEFMA